MTIDLKLLRKAEQEIMHRLKPALKKYVHSSETHIAAVVKYAQLHPKVSKSLGKQLLAAKKSLVRVKNLVR